MKRTVGMSTYVESNINKNSYYIKPMFLYLRILCKILNISSNEQNTSYWLNKIYSNGKLMEYTESTNQHEGYYTNGSRNRPQSGGRSVTWAEELTQYEKKDENS